MRLALVALVALITIAGLPPRLWRPQLMRVGGLCAVIFLFSALGSDGAAPLVADRSPPPMPGNLPPSMADLATNKYSYTVLNLGIFSVTKRSLSLAVTLAGLTFVALQSASLCLVTTPPERMAVAVGRFLRPLGLIRVPVKELVLTVLLALRFMATVFEEARNLCLGLASRGIDWSLVGTRGALALGLRTCIKLFRNLLARSESIAVAMAARGFRGPEEHRLFVESNRAGSVVSDALAVASLAGLIGLSTVFT